MLCVFVFSTRLYVQDYNTIVVGGDNFARCWLSPHRRGAQIVFDEEAPLWHDASVDMPLNISLLSKNTDKPSKSCMFNTVDIVQLHPGAVNLLPGHKRYMFTEQE